MYVMPTVQTHRPTLVVWMSGAPYPGPRVTQGPGRADPQTSTIVTCFCFVKLFVAY